RSNPAGDRGASEPGRGLRQRARQAVRDGDAHASAAPPRIGGKPSHSHREGRPRPVLRDGTGRSGLGRNLDRAAANKLERPARPHGGIRGGLTRQRPATKGEEVWQKTQIPLTTASTSGSIARSRYRGTSSGRHGPNRLTSRSGGHPHPG